MEQMQRLFKILELLPTFPRRISSSEIHSRLIETGFNKSIRTIQRDLDTLAKFMPIDNDKNTDMLGWYWKKNADIYQLKSMDPNVALTFKLFSKLLDKALPPSTQEYLQPYFKEADKILNSKTHSKLCDWSNRVAYISKTIPLIAPHIDSQVLADVYEALRFEKQLKAEYIGKYQNESKSNNDEKSPEKIFNPHSIIVVEENIYLLANTLDNKMLKTFALARFKTSEVLSQDAQLIANFNLQKYIDEGHLGYFNEKNPDNKTIIVRISMTKETSAHFKETPISADQKFEEDTHNNRDILEATVANTKKLRWWIRSFSHEMVVLFPKSLRDELEAETQLTLTNYQKLTQNLN